eukprot:Sdes_comp19530_c0_seq1m11115
MTLWIRRTCGRVLISFKNPIHSNRLPSLKHGFRLYSSQTSAPQTASSSNTLWYLSSAFLTTAAFSTFYFTRGFGSLPLAPASKVNQSDVKTSIEVPQQNILPASTQTESEKKPEQIVEPREEPAQAEASSSPMVDRPEFPQQVQYVLIGAGTASFAAVKGIQEKDPKAKILIIGDEAQAPYMRPPLSKELWFSKHSPAEGAEGENQKTPHPDVLFKDWGGNQRSIFYEPLDFFCAPEELNAQADGGVALLLGQKVERLDVARKSVFLSDGRNISFEKCLLATGGKPGNLAVLEKSDPQVKSKITLYRTLQDFEKVNQLVTQKKTIAIIGSGFLGSELACALAHRNSSEGGKVYQIFREQGNMGRVFPKYLREWTTEKVKSQGVEVISNSEVISASSENHQLRLELSSGKIITVDHAIVAVGIEPNVEIAQRAGLEIDPIHKGVLCNAELQARSDIYVAGDVCSFHDISLGRRRVEHHDHAVVSGRLAGENMAGGRTPYWHQSMFWSDLGPHIGYEAIGLVDSSLETYGVWALAGAVDSPQGAVTAGPNIRSGDSSFSAEKTNVETEMKLESGNPAGEVPLKGNGESFGKGVVFYLKNKKVVGVLLWNIFDKIPQARRLIKNSPEFNDLSELSSIFNVHK